MNGVFGQALWAKTPCQLTAQNGANHPMCIANGQGCLDLPAFLQGWLGQVEQCLIVEGVLQAMILGNLAVPANLRASRWLVQDS